MGRWHCGGKEGERAEGRETGQRVCCFDFKGRIKGCCTWKRKRRKKNRMTKMGTGKSNRRETGEDRLGTRNNQVLDIAQ